MEVLSDDALDGFSLALVRTEVGPGMVEHQEARSGWTYTSSPSSLFLIGQIRTEKPQGLLVEVGQENNVNSKSRHAFD